MTVQYLLTDPAVLDVLAQGDLKSDVQGPVEALTTMLKAFGSLFITWFLFKQLMTSFTVSRMLAAGFVAGAVVWLLQLGGMEQLYEMAKVQMEPISPLTSVW